MTAIDFSLIALGVLFVLAAVARLLYERVTTLVYSRRQRRKIREFRRSQRKHR